MRNFFNLPQAGFGTKGKRWSPRIGVSTAVKPRSRGSDNTESPNALSFRNADYLLPAPIRQIAIFPVGGRHVSNTACRKARTERAPVDGIGLPGMVAFMMLVPGSGRRWKT